MRAYIAEMADSLLALSEQIAPTTTK
jgi:hypothetical protein